MDTPSRLLRCLIILGGALILHLPFALGGGGATPASAEPWLHIKVVENGPDGETVRVNVPLSLAEAVVPLMGHEDDDSDSPGHRHRHRRFTVNNRDFSASEMRAILEAFHQAEDGEYVAVDSPDEKVRVSKTDDYFIIDIDDRGDEHEQVKVRMHTDLLEALLSGGPDELNFEAAVRALRSQTGKDLVTVISDDETVRIWVDERKTAE